MHVHGADPLDDSPGFPTSAPYHSKDTLSPTAAPWASAIPHAAPSVSHPLPYDISPAGSSGAITPTSTAAAAAASEAAGEASGFSGSTGRSLSPSASLITLPRLGQRLSGSGSDDIPAASGAGGAAAFLISEMGGAGGGMPPPGAGAAAMAASAAASGPRKAPEAVIDAGVPRMPSRVAVGPTQGPAEKRVQNQWQPARKRIQTAEDLKRFLEGQSVKDLMAFILSINEAVTGKKANDPSYSPSPAVQRMCGLLTELGAMVDEVPPEEQSLRYGNPAFRTWCTRLSERAPALLLSLFPPPEAAAAANPPPTSSSDTDVDIEMTAAPTSSEDGSGVSTAANDGSGSSSSGVGNPTDGSSTPTGGSSTTVGGSSSSSSLDHLRGAVVELVPYLLDSFGNATRIDYGTGHETQFVALLYCLAKLGVFEEADRQGLGLNVFKQYLELMRKIQTTYWLEPAGSHGVWGLDDYQFLPFIWGSAQLIAHPLIKPRSIHNPDILEAYADAYLYLGCVKFVKQVKKGSLSETSPMLNDISCVPNWAKVNSGMVKMYQVEVLSKFPIMQHFMFGSLLAFE